ncbi:MAG: aminotransferase class I/II-fold pyridoxal phosphate-dependent enzyme [Deltaproteobacteria bacterium]|nr:MAG: aminotransferase class I/II-fold pyridoxal phosphate-dependent enzyme [Deltaproteobacteria bacterium]
MTQPSLNLNLRGLPQSATLAINARSRELQQQGRRVYRFGLGQSPFPVPAPIVDALRLHAPQKDYLPVEGLPALREAVADFHRRRDHFAATADGVLVGPGSKELMFLLQVAYYGDLVVPTPCWVSYGPQARIIGRNVVLLPTTFEHRWRLRPEQLEALCARDPSRPRVVILNYPGNPDGGTYTRDELAALAEVARKHHVLVLSDEIYGPLHHVGEHHSIAAIYPEGTIVSGGLSKWCGAGGWRLGTFTFPRELGWLQEAMAAAASETYTSVSAPIQYAAVTAFRGGLQLERYLGHSRRILAGLAAAMTALLRAADVRLHEPEGGFYAMLDFSRHRDALARRGIEDSVQLCERLLDETGVALLPGASFERSPTELTARLAYVDFDGAEALAASEHVPMAQPLPAGFVETHCGHVLDGVRALCAWLTGAP